jgi:SAM-dependent methyltransferase
MTSWFGRLLGQDGAPVPVTSSRQPRRWDPDGSPDDFVELCFRIVLGRIPEPFERGEHTRSLEAGVPRDDVRRAFVESPEFLLRRRDWRVKLPPAAGADAALDELGDEAEFVGHCYRVLLGRQPDDEGVAFYVGHLRARQPRGWVVRTLGTSREFNDRWAGLSDTGTPPVDVQLCELANPAKWDNPAWLDILLSYRVIPDHKEAMHRKGYEFTQLAFGLRQLGVLQDGARVLSVGAGHEAPAFWLANHAGRVIATDLYAGAWQSVGACEGSARVLQRPEDFAPFPYRADRLAFMRMDGRRLGFRDATFDIAYSLSSIEHFGGILGASDAVREMARVLKPGGVLALATEWCIDGPGGDEIFTPDEVRQLVTVPGLRLVEPIDDRVWSRYRSEPVDVERTPKKTPHMLLRQGESVFTSVMLFLRRV